jgi:hypothetical protein
MGPLHYKVQDKEHVTVKIEYNTNLVAVIAVCTCVVRLSQYSKNNDIRKHKSFCFEIEVFTVCAVLK